MRTPICGARRQPERDAVVRRGILARQPEREDLFGRRRRGRGPGARPLHEDRGAADDRRRAGEKIDGADPACFGGPGRERELLRVLHLVGGERELRRQLQREIRRAQLPFVLQLDRGQLLIERAARVAAGGPRQDDVQLLRRQRVGALDLAVAFVSIPRRHVRGHELRADRLRPRKRVVVGHQRHRRHAARHVAAARIDRGRSETRRRCRCIST